MTQELAANFQKPIQDLVGHATVFFVAHRSKNIARALAGGLSNQNLVEEPLKRRNSPETSLKFLRRAFTEQKKRTISEMRRQRRSHARFGLAPGADGGKIAEVRHVDQDATWLSDFVNQFAHFGLPLSQVARASHEVSRRDP